MRTEPVRGDLLEVHWVDIAEDTLGDPDKADLARRVSYGLFWDKKDVMGIPCTVTTTTLDPTELVGQSGWCIYPDACIIALKIVRRVRVPRLPKPKVAKENLTPKTVSEAPE
jgi:hypothetical protein